MHRRVLTVCFLSGRAMLCWVLALPAALALSTPTAAQTWTGAAADGGNWNNAANWADPGVVPNSPTADVVFGPSAVNGVSIPPGPFQVRSLSFASATNSYVLSIPLIVGPKILTDLRTITVADNVTTTQQISLGGDASGSLLFTGSGPAALTIANNALPTAVASPTLLIGPFTTIGTPGSGGITVSGTGTTTLSGAFATNATANHVIGGLTKTGPGTLTLSGDGSGLTGGLTLAGGTLRLDYSTNLSSKLGGGGLRSSGGDLVLVPHGSAAVTQNVGSTALTAGHTEVNVTSGGAFTIGLGAITRSTGATFNIPSLLATTLTGNTNGLLGTGRAFATADGQAWAAASGGRIVGITGTPTFGSMSNTDVTFPLGTPAAFSINSLRFQLTEQTLNLSLVNNIESGGILLPSNVATATITGGALQSSQNEIITHVYGSNLTIGSQILAPSGLTKTGPGTLTLAGNNSFLNSALNVNRGHLRVTNPLAIVTIGTINFNDNSTRPGQTFSVEVGDGTNAATNAAIRLSSNSAPGAQAATVFSTATSQNSRVTLGGVISSAPGAATSLLLTGESNNTSGFNLTGVNTFTGTVRLEKGTLGINSNASLGIPDYPVILNTSNSTAGGLEFLTFGIDVARPVTVEATTRVISNGTDINTISGPVTGSGTLVKAGTGTLVLTNAGNDGPRDIRGGTLRVAALGTTGDLFLSDGVTLAVTGDNSLDAARTVTLGSVPGPATATVDVAANQTFTVDGPVTNNVGSFGALVKTGAGALALTGTANTYSGGTVVRVGAVQAIADGSLGAADAPVAVEVAGMLTFTGSTTTGRDYTLSGARLGVNAGQTLTFADSTVAGGFLFGQGAFATQAGTTNTFVGNTSFSGSSFTLAGLDDLIAYTNGGLLTKTPGQSAALTQFTNTASGRMVVNAGMFVGEFVSHGLVTVNAGGTVDNIASPMVLAGGSRTTVNVGGTINLSGGTTLELNGALLVNNGTVSGTMNVNFGSVAKGAGAYGIVNVNQGGVYSPGNSPGVSTAAAVNIDDSPTTVAGPVLMIELAGVAAGTEYDQLHVAGQLSLGGTLAVSLLEGFVPEAGQSFDILDWGTLSGQFSSLHLPVLDGLSWDASQLYSAGVLAVRSPAFYEADFDEDGDVDADDLDHWKGDFGLNALSDADDDGDSDGADFLTWQRQLGQGAPLVAMTEPIPEPCTLALATMICCVLARIRPRRRSNAQKSLFADNPPLAVSDHKVFQSQLSRNS